jgi:hypothetical protein
LTICGSKIACPTLTDVVSGLAECPTEVFSKLLGFQDQYNTALVIELIVVTGSASTLFYPHLLGVFYIPL